MKQSAMGLSLSARNRISVSGPVISRLDILSASETSAQVIFSAAPIGATAYLFVSQSATPPNQGTLVAGTGADWHGSLVVTNQPSGTPGPTGLTPDTTYYLHAIVDDAGESSPIVSVSFSTTLPDTVAPVLSAGGFTVIDQTSADLIVSTNEANGTLHVIATLVQGAPLANQIQLGRDSTGAAAAYANLGQAVSDVGTQNVSATGLTEAVHYAYFLHEDAAGNISNMVEVGPVTPADVTAPVVSSVEVLANGHDAATVIFNTDTGEGTGYIIVQPEGDTAPTVTQVVNGSSGTVQGLMAVSAGGQQTFDVSAGLSPGIFYHAYVVHADAAGNNSPVVASIDPAQTESDIAQSWSNSGFDVFSTSGIGFTAENTTAGSGQDAYSNAYVDVAVDDVKEIEIILGAGTSATTIDVALSSNGNIRSTVERIDGSGGGTFTATVTATSAGTFSVLVRLTSATGVVELTSAEVRDPSTGFDATGGEGVITIHSAPSVTAPTATHGENTITIED